MNIIGVRECAAWFFQQSLKKPINTGECFMVIIKICTATTIEEIAKQNVVAFPMGISNVWGVSRSLISARAWSKLILLDGVNPAVKRQLGSSFQIFQTRLNNAEPEKNETTEQIYPLTVYTNKLSFIPSMPCPPLFHQIFSMASCQMMSWWWEPCVTPEENLWNYHILLRLQFEARKLHQMKSPWNWRSSKLKDSTQEVTEKKSTQPPQLSPLGVVNLRPSYGGNLKAFLHHVAGNLAALQLALQAGEVPQILQKKQIQLIHIYICIYIYIPLWIKIYVYLIYDVLFTLFRAWYT